MRIKDEKSAFSEMLCAWFKNEGRKLPWRETRNPYYILVSEVMLQQTQVATVIPYYLRFIDRLPRLEDLAKANDDLLHELWEGLGYYSRVFRLRALANAVIEEHNGQIPKEREALMKLPGIGPYTLGAVRSFAFEEGEPAVDGNVKRVMARLMNNHLDITKTSFAKEVDQVVRDILPKDVYNFNQGLIELGAIYCRPKNPLCEECPVKSFCEAKVHKTVDSLPNKPKKKKQREEKMTVFFLVSKEKKVLFVRRPSDGLLASMWGLPMSEKASKIAYSEYFREEFGIHIDKDIMKEAKDMGQVKHVFSHVIWDMQLVELPLEPYIESLHRIESPQIVIAKAEDMSLPTAFKKCINTYQKRLKS